MVPVLTRAGLGLAAVICGQFLAPSRPLAAREPVRVESDADRAVVASFVKHAEDCVRRFTPQSVAKIEQPEDICWVWSGYARLPLTAFLLTGDTAHLDRFLTAIDALSTRLRKGPDGYLGFRGLPLPPFRPQDGPAPEIDVDITEFEIARLMCDYVEAVRAEPSLAPRYRDKAAEYLRLAEEHLAGKKWEARGLYVDLGPKGAVFRMPAECGNGRDHLTNPHNKQSKMCRAYLALYRVTGNDDYFRKALKLGTRFKRTLVLDGGRYRWHYWDPAGDWDRKPGGANAWKHWIGPEHRGGYHALTLAMADALYDHGVVFDRTDLERFVSTQIEVSWNGSLDAPSFKNSEGKLVTGAVFLAPSLARFQPKIWQFCYGPRAAEERLARRDHNWQGGVAAIEYLVGKYLSPRTAEPQHTSLRDQFCRKPENAALLKQLEFRVPPRASGS